MIKSLRIKIAIITALLIFTLESSFAQDLNYVNWEISSSDLVAGKLEMYAGQTKTITFSVTVKRFLDSNNNWTSVNFSVHLKRFPSSTQSCGSCPIISTTQTITSADFASGAATATKQFTASVTAQSGSSLTGPALRGGDKILMVTSGPWSPTNKEYSVTVSNDPPPISNNTIANSGSSSFNDAGDPSFLNGSTPTGGIGTFTYKWQSSTTSNSSGFSDIVGATAQSYNPPAIQYTTYYRRIVNSSTATSISNAITISIIRTGATFNNPILIGNLGICSTYSSVLDNSPINGYGNEIGNSSDDIFYKFNLVTAAKVTLANCKSDGVSSTFYLWDANGIDVQGGISGESCDVGGEVIYELQPGVYYVVTEGPYGSDYMHTLPIHIWVHPIMTTSPDVTIQAGSSTTLSAFGGADSYRWSTTNPWLPVTGLSSTTGASVNASPAESTGYMVTGTWAGGCNVYKYIYVTVSGAIGSTINNPIEADIDGCGFHSRLVTTGYGNDYGGPSEDIFYKFDLKNETGVGFWVEAHEPSHLVLLNSLGAFIGEQYYGWIDSGDDAGTHYWGLLEGSSLPPLLQPGTYFLVAEGTYIDALMSVYIRTAAASTCRQATAPAIEKITKTQMESKDAVNGIAYPNPANNNVTFKLEQDAPAFIHIVNSNGVTVKETMVSEKSAELNISDLPAGLYLIKIIQQNRMRSEKLIIER